MYISDVWSEENKIPLQCVLDIALFSMPNCNIYQGTIELKLEFTLFFLEAELKVKLDVI